MLSEAKHLAAHHETLRFAQGDNTLPILFVKLHNRRCGHRRVIGISRRRSLPRRQLAQRHPHRQLLASPVDPHLYRIARIFAQQRVR